MVSTKRWLRKEKKVVLKSIGKHALLFSVIGFLSYYGLLTLRKYLGYFDYPFLTALSELNWFILGIALLSLFGIGGAVGYVKHKRGKKKRGRR